MLEGGFAVRLNWLPFVVEGEFWQKQQTVTESVVQVENVRVDGCPTECGWGIWYCQCLLEQQHGLFEVVGSSTNLARVCELEHVVQGIVNLRFVRLERIAEAADVFDLPVLAVVGGLLLVGDELVPAACEVDGILHITFELFQGCPDDSTAGTLFDIAFLDETLDLPLGLKQFHCLT